MIRDYAPIALIPSAWILTFLTIIHPGISELWVQQMHHFMLIFLIGFTFLSWREMKKDEILDIWRKVIAAGILFTGLGALSFQVRNYAQILAWTSIIYWFVGPATGLYYSSLKMDEYSNLYRKLSGESLVAVALFILGTYSGVVSLQIIGVLGIAAAQTLSILKASELDSD